ncbi:MAG: aminopeptidase [Acidobacteriota bacterium]|nr:aminopeptidase [Acidobacteriota bacterium]
MKTACEHALRHNLGVRPGESVLVVTDGTRDAVATAFEHAARSLSAAVERVVIPVPERNGQEPPSEVAVRMKAADVVLIPVARSMSWTRARMEATACGVRIASMANIDETIIDRTFTLDYRRIRDRVNRFCDLLDEARSVRVTSDLGTELTFEIDGREAHGRKGGIYTEPGSWGNLPCGEAFIAPVEGTATGRYVIDASHAGVGRISSPITITVDAGRAVEIAGGPEAASLSTILEAVGDPLAYNVAEFGIGCNDGARITGVILEDEKALGTCHIALGHNAFFGGSVEVPVHVDGVMRAPTILLDDRVVVVRGEPAVDGF